MPTTTRSSSALALVCVLPWIGSGCASPTPVCNNQPGSYECLTCLSNLDCFSGTQVCDTGLDQCRMCQNDGECASNPALPLCKETIIDLTGIGGDLITYSLCVQCTSDAHCSGGTPYCNVTSSTCEAAPACTQDSDCTGTPSVGHKMTCSSGSCTETQLACPSGASGAPNCSCDNNADPGISWDTTTSSWKGTCNTDPCFPNPCGFNTQCCYCSTVDPNCNPEGYICVSNDPYYEPYEKPYFCLQ